jgi:predicted site-specific integrase-resolvase
MILEMSSATRSAAIYARVSSARQKEQETIGSQTAALRARRAAGA